MLRSMKTWIPCLVGLAIAWVPAAAHGSQAGPCLPPGVWMKPKAEETIANDALIAGMAARPVVLLGEEHTNAEHHRWQLSTIAALHGRKANLVLGFEMFPRRAQPVLDRWVAGELGEKAFLEATRWSEVWGYDAALYAPLFHFARLHGIRMVALNVEKSLIDRVGDEGWRAVPPEARQGISDPAPAAPSYIGRLAEVFARHVEAAKGNKGAAAEGDGPTLPDPDDPRFRRFVEAQLTWDRAIAQALAEARHADAEKLVVGVIGRGHLEYGYGVSHQLADLGIPDAAVLLPWDAARPCEALAPEGEPAIADAVFSLNPPSEAAAPARPRLGILMEGGEGGMRIKKVVAASIAERAGLKADDLIVEAAGVPTPIAKDLIDVVQRQAPGTWLPLRVRRNGETVEVVAKFPPAP